MDINFEDALERRRRGEDMTAYLFGSDRDELWYAFLTALDYIVDVEV